MIHNAPPRTRQPDDAMFAHFFGDYDPYPVPVIDRPPATRWPASTATAAPRPAQPDVSVVPTG